MTWIWAGWFLCLVSRRTQAADQQVDERARHRDLSYATGVAVKVASRTSVLVNGTRATIEYQPGEEFRGVNLAESFNGYRRTADAGLAVALTPVTTLTGTVAREEQRFDLSPIRDSNSWRVLSTVSFIPTGVVTGSASVGYRRFEPLTATEPGYSGLVSNVAVGATIYERHQMTAVFNRDVHSYETENTNYLGTGARSRGRGCWSAPSTCAAWRAVLMGTGERPRFRPR